MTLRQLERRLGLSGDAAGYLRAVSAGALRAAAGARRRASSAGRCAASSRPARGSPAALRTFWALPPRR